MQSLQSALGVFALIAFAWAVSENRSAVSLRRIGVGLALTFVLAVLFLKVPPITRAFGSANHAIDAIAAASRSGTSFVFGYIGGGALPFELKFPGKEFVLAFNALPIVLLMSVLTTLLFYWGILPPVVKGFAFVLNRTMGVGGAVGLSDRRQHLRRTRRGTAVHPALSRQAFAERTVRGDDRRHGRHRRHRAGALRAVSP